MSEWIYFFEEPVRHRGLIELGSTRRTVEERNRDKRSVDPWREIARYPVANCQRAEQEIIRATASHRYRCRKEILKIDWNSLKKIIEPICHRHTDIEYEVGIRMRSYDITNYKPKIKQVLERETKDIAKMETEAEDLRRRMRAQAGLYVEKGGMNDFGVAVFGGLVAAVFLMLFILSIESLGFWGILLFMGGGVLLTLLSEQSSNSKRAQNKREAEYEKTRTIDNAVNQFRRQKRDAIEYWKKLELGALDDVRNTHASAIRKQILAEHKTSTIKAHSGNW